MTDTTTKDPNPREIEVTPEMIDAGLAAMEPFAFTSFDGYDMPKALPEIFRAMLKAKASENG